MMPILIFSLLLPISVLAASPRTIMSTEALAIAGGETQTLIFTRPADNRPHPALLFIGGMGCYSVNFPADQDNAYKRVLDRAEALGMVTIRLEKTGIGGSIGTPCEQQSFVRELIGYFAVMKNLKDYSFIDTNNVLIFGHSIGGVIAPILAAKFPVKSVAVLGSLAGKWYDYDLSNTRHQLLLSGESKQNVDYFMRYKKIASTELLINKRSPAEIISLEPNTAPYLENPVHYTYIQELNDFDIGAILEKSTATYTMYYGASDFIGSQESAIIPFVQTVNMVRRTPVLAKKIPNLDHFFNNAESQEASFAGQHADGSALQLQSAFYDELTNWMSENLKN